MRSGRSAAGNEKLLIDSKDNLRVNADVAVIDGGVYEHLDLNVFSRTNCVPPKLRPRNCRMHRFPKM
jgi:hypothetical protein